MRLLFLIASIACIGLIGCAPKQLVSPVSGVAGAYEIRSGNEAQELRRALMLFARENGYRPIGTDRQRGERVLTMVPAGAAEGDRHPMRIAIRPTGRDRLVLRVSAADDGPAEAAQQFAEQLAIHLQAHERRTRGTSRRMGGGRAASI